MRSVTREACIAANQHGSIDSIREFCVEYESLPHDTNTQYDELKRQNTEIQQMMRDIRQQLATTNLQASTNAVQEGQQDGCMQRQEVTGTDAYTATEHNPHQTCSQQTYDPARQRYSRREQYAQRQTGSSDQKATHAHRTYTPQVQYSPHRSQQHTPSTQYSQHRMQHIPSKIRSSSGTRRNDNMQTRNQSRPDTWRHNAYSQSSTCTKCGMIHRYATCPAQGQVCRRCHRLSHFERVCHSNMNMMTYTQQPQY